ncbi:MAG: hypothetical protein E7672_06070 [Ruminococcaceae bacterium]|nr:hypothetical protein [Oscillospiraceae bacterium]
MSELTTYKCPCCGGAVEFRTEIQKMQCPYCDTEFEIDDLKAYNDSLSDENNSSQDNMSWQSDSENEWEDGETDGMNVYVCHSCGGEIVCDETTAATSCPFCSNPVVMKGQFAGDLRPDLVIPFKLNKKAAKEALIKHFAGKRLLPKVFKDENHIEEIKGIYVPFWIFDSDANANLRFKGTKVHTYRDRKYQYTETKYYSVQRGGTISYSGIPVDGSRKIADELMESIEPYDIREAVDFKTAYLSGFFADKYDVTSDECAQRANERIKENTETVFRREAIGYSTLVLENSSINLLNGKIKYALFPVWLLTTTWNGETYHFAMNGQTGKFVGDLPLDKSAYAKWLIGLTAICSAAVYGLMWLVL